MTRKDYVNMAKRLRLLKDRADGVDIRFYLVIDMIESFFKADNAAFDRDKFRDAIFND